MMRTRARQRSTAVVAATVAFPLLIGGCSKKESTDAGASAATTTTAAPTNVNNGTVITINEYKFEPGDAKAKVGELVTWKNEQAISHTVTQDVPDEQRKIKSDRMQQGQTYQLSFQAPGTYQYICSVHPEQMRGTITVA